MQTGVGLIGKERLEQLQKHGRTVKHDVEHNNMEQLKHVANSLLTGMIEDYEGDENWDEALFYKIMEKPEIERLAIAGALIAAEIDRLIAIESKSIHNS